MMSSRIGASGSNQPFRMHRASAGGICAGPPNAEYNEEGVDVGVDAAVPPDKEEEEEVMVVGVAVPAPAPTPDAGVVDAVAVEIPLDAVLVELPLALPRLAAARGLVTVPVAVEDAAAGEEEEEEEELDACCCCCFCSPFEDGERSNESSPPFPAVLLASNRASTGSRVREDLGVVAAELGVLVLLLASATSEPVKVEVVLLLVPSLLVDVATLLPVAVPPPFGATTTIFGKG